MLYSPSSLLSFWPQQFEEAPAVQSATDRVLNLELCLKQKGWHYLSHAIALLRDSLQRNKLAWWDQSKGCFQVLLPSEVHVASRQPSSPGYTVTWEQGCCRRAQCCSGGVQVPRDRGMGAVLARFEKRDKEKWITRHLTWAEDLLLSSGLVNCFGYSEMQFESLPDACIKLNPFFFSFFLKIRDCFVQCWSTSEILLRSLEVWVQGGQRGRSCQIAAFGTGAAIQWGFWETRGLHRCGQLPGYPPVPDARHLLKKNRIRSLCTAWAGCFQKGLPFRAGPFRALLSSAATCWLAEYLLPSQMGPITARSWLAPVPGVLKGSHSAAVQSRARRAAGRTLTSAESEMIWAVDEYGKYMLTQPDLKWK